MSELGVEGIRAIHAEDIRPVLESLTPEEWAMPSACAGWRVQEVVSHMTSNMRMFVDPQPMPDPPEGSGPLGAEQMAELMLGERLQWTPEQVMDEYNAMVDGFVGAMAGMQDPSVGSTMASLGELGTHPTHIFSDVFTFDHYCHLRIDMLQPSGPLQRDVPAADRKRLKPTIDWMMAGMAPMCQAALTMVDRPIQFTFTGPGESSWTLGPAGDDGLCTMVEEASSDAAAVVTSDGHDYVSWGTQRSAWSDSCTLSGDQDYAAAVLNAINII